ncbi:hypothetical protein [Peterkaempfera sp. SMS 1(5)a]|uniref:hypothetical protein n=1 Tax=Peterkaempfera podocarpi TaxID=3232308 RepID=UPI003671BAA4
MTWTDRVCPPPAPEQAALQAEFDLASDASPFFPFAAVAALLDHPEFSGATRGRLEGATVRACVGEAVQEHLGGWLAAHPERAAAVVGRMLQGARGAEQ